MKRNKSSFGMVKIMLKNIKRLQNLEIILYNLVNNQHNNVLEYVVINKNLEKNGIDMIINDYV